MWTQYRIQLEAAYVWLEKERAAIIMQAWIDGCTVTEIHDEIIIEGPKP
jgi:hypothetical protein